MHDWKLRRAAVEGAARAYLIANTGTFTTRQLSELLAPSLNSAPDKIASDLSRLARAMPGFARQDGEQFIFMGKPARRWNWYGKGNTHGVT